MGKLQRERWAQTHDCCIKCGTAERKHAADGLCRGCYHKQYYRNNQDKLKEYGKVHNKQWREENKERKAEYDKQYRGDNKELRKQWNSEWSKANPENRRANTRNYQAKKHNNGGTHTEEDIKLLLNLSGHQCQRPECSATEDLEIDHVIPLSRGGRNDITNLQVLCKSCNCSKGNRHSTDYRSHAYKLLIDKLNAEDQDEINISP